MICNQTPSLAQPDGEAWCLRPLYCVQGSLLFRPHSPAKYQTVLVTRGKSVIYLIKKLFKQARGNRGSRGLGT